MLYISLAFHRVLIVQVETFQHDFKTYATEFGCNNHDA